MPANRRNGFYRTNGDSVNWIDKAYDRMIRCAESTINENTERYKQAISATIEYEAIFAKRELEAGNQTAFKHHEIMTEVYLSLLEKLDQ
jgi:hypothetical protein